MIWISERRPTCDILGTYVDIPGFENEIFLRLQTESIGGGSEVSTLEATHPLSLTAQVTRSIVLKLFPAYPACPMDLVDNRYQIACRLLRNHTVPSDSEFYAKFVFAYRIVRQFNLTFSTTSDQKIRSLFHQYMYLVRMHSEMRSTQSNTLSIQHALYVAKERFDSDLQSVFGACTEYLGCIPRNPFSFVVETTHQKVWTLFMKWREGADIGEGLRHLLPSPII